MKLRVVLVFTLVALVVALSACGGGGGGPITVTMTEFAFDPSQITVQSGQEVTIRFDNKGSVAHNFAVPDLNVKSPDVPAGQSATIQFTPDRTGNFRFLCTIPGHEAGGMVGQLIVQ